MGMCRSGGGWRDIARKLGARGGTYQRNGHLWRDIERVDQNALPFLKMRGKGNKDVGKTVEAGIVHSSF